MTAVTFDTLKFANRLKAAGVPDKQAEAEAEVLSEVLEVNLRELATKEDLRRLEAVTKEDLRRLEERFDVKLTQLEQRMTIKLGTLMVISVGAVAALVKVL